MLYIFDIFNTIIMPKTATFQGVFALMQKELQENPAYQKIANYIKDNFYELRIHSEDLARRQYQRHGVEEITLKQIYEALATTGVIDTDDISVLIKLECKLLIDNLIGVEKYISLIKYLLKTNKKVIFLADTYLDKEIVLRILADIDLLLLGIPLYLSSIHKARKASGKLYHIIKISEQVEYNNWRYFGVDDAGVLKCLGIKKLKNMRHLNLWKFEEKYLCKQHNNYCSQLIIGSGNVVRMKALENSAVIGCTIGGPILFSYAQWVIEESKRRGIKRLYFIARDGYIPKKVVDILLEKWNVDIKTHYLYGSRKAWRMPSYDGKIGTVRRIIAMSNPDRLKSLTDIAEVLKIDKDDLKAFLGDFSADEKLSYCTISLLAKRLDENQKFRGFLVERQTLNRKMVQRYLKQEIDMKDEKFAFVEIGGTGFTQKCLANLLKDYYKEPIWTFFFKMDRIVNEKDCKYLNFLPSNLKTDLLIELLCRAPHGQTDSYIECNEKIKPVLTGNEGTFLKSYGYDMYVEGIEKYTEFYATQVKKYNVSVNLEALICYIENIMKPKDKAILDFFADMPYSPSGRENKMAAFAPTLTKKNIRDVYLFHPGQSVARYYEGTDIEYARLRCSEGEKRKIDFYQKNRDVIIDRLQRLTKRSFVETQEENNNLFKGFPYSYFGSTFVLYGAGKWGTQFHDSAIAANCHIVQWLDKNYRLLAAKGLAVSGALPDLDKAAKYDAVFVAVSNQRTALEIKNELLKFGVDEKKIVILFEYMSVLDI